MAGNQVNNSLQDRAICYMKEAIRILEISRSDKTNPIIENPLILPLVEPCLPDDVITLLNKNYLKLANSAMLTGNLLEALKYYKEVNTLQSVYSQAQLGPNICEWES